MDTAVPDSLATRLSIEEVSVGTYACMDTATVKPPRCADTEAGAPLVLLQTIMTQWSKAARGAPAAALRRGVPDALLIPAALTPTPVVGVIRHEVRCGERDGFRIPESSTVQRDVLNDTLHAHNLSVTLNEELLRVDLAWTYGAPMRHPVRGIMSLAVGEWGRVRFNYRTSSAPWVYVQAVANIGWFL